MLKNGIVIVEMQNEGLNSDGSKVRSKSFPEYVVLETSSSFESTPFLISLFNLPSIIVHVEL